MEKVKFKNQKAYENCAKCQEEKLKSCEEIVFEGDFLFKERPVFEKTSK